MSSLLVKKQAPCIHGVLNTWCTAPTAL